tara:strand:- start:1247 stop:1819 length:573 start_codon:yes stop_codon:yes gene_type:complete
MEKGHFGQYSGNSRASYQFISPVTGSDQNLDNSEEEKFDSPAQNSKAYLSGMGNAASGLKQKKPVERVGNPVMVEPTATPSSEDDMYFKSQAYNENFNREVIPNMSDLPLNSAERAAEYAQRGWAKDDTVALPQTSSGNGYVSGMSAMQMSALKNRYSAMPQSESQTNTFGPEGTNPNPEVYAGIVKNNK